MGGSTARWGASVSGLLFVCCGGRTGLEAYDEAGLPPLARAERPSVAAPDAAPESPAPFGTPDAVRADRLDLLFVLDNSQSMGDKQAILAAAIPDLVARLTNPECVDARTLLPNAAQPASSLDPCPPGGVREFNPVQDLHVGIVTSSLSPVDPACSIPQFSTSAGDGRLVSRGAASYQGLGFLAWDPSGSKSPPGEVSAPVFRDVLRDMVRGVGEGGCALEAPLEAMYHFLIDPDPAERMARVDCLPGSGRGDCAVPTGVDQALLAQRQTFLRRDSMVVVILLSDENDCSIAPWGVSLLGTAPLALSTSECLVDPSARCCRQCGAPAPTGCAPDRDDSRCAEVEVAGFLRCFDQKRRYGFDGLYPVSRYVTGLTEPEVPGADGAPRPNPLFVDPVGTAKPRDPSLVFFTTIVGVPWQDLAVDPFDTEELVYKTPAQMRADGSLSWVVGDAGTGAPPGDPLMVESLDPRRGTNPALGAVLGPPSALSPLSNPINGHEMLLTEAGWDLQYACVFDLDAPRQGSNDCLLGPRTSPLCQATDGTYGTTQYRAKAYPGRRQLEVARGVGDNAIMASICARNVVDPTRDDYGYRPALRALLDRLRGNLR